MKSIIIAGAFAAAVGLGTAQAAVYASNATFVNTTAFGSGILTGAPDGGGRFLGTTTDPAAVRGSITFEFAQALIDGAGGDFRLYEIASSSNETFNIALSLDGVSFSNIGGYNATNAIIDVAGLFVGAFRFVRLTSTSDASADFDAIEALNLAPNEVPLPAALPLMMAGLAFGGALTRKKKTA